MKVAIHQPQYHPWINYYRKIARADIFVYLNDVQFQKNGLQNRNKIKTSSGELWLTIPVQQSLDQKICNVKTQGYHWKKKHAKSITQNYKDSNSYFYENFGEIYEDMTDNLFDTNRQIVEITKNIFKIKTEIILQSDLSVRGNKSDLILNICKALNCTTYISGEGGKNYLDHQTFEENNIAIEVVKNISIKYPQYFPNMLFIPDLSALDFILCVKSAWDKYLKF